MSEIKVGDLVMVVRPYRCGCTNRLGAIFQVTELRTFEYGSPWLCIHCNASGTMTSRTYAMYGQENRDGENLSLLRRIDPLSEPETIEREEVA